MMKNKKIKNIAIIGLGLIGGSLAKALKINNYHIIGFSRNPETIKTAMEENVINDGYLEITEENLRDIDLIFLTPPLDLIPKYIKKVAELVKHEIILTDGGSTKQEICDVAKNVLPENITFIGGHPMAGTEKAGYSASQIELFKNCAWILTPIDDSEKTKLALEILKNIIIEIGSKPVTSKPENHDRAVALVSHLPLLASIGLCQILRNQKDIELQRLAELIASSGYRDTTRIGGGNPNMNANLISSNIGELLSLIPNYYKEIETITSTTLEDPKALEKMLIEVNQWRSKLYNKEGKNNLLNKGIL